MKYKTTYSTPNLISKILNPNKLNISSLFVDNIINENQLKILKIMFPYQLKISKIIGNNYIILQEGIQSKKDFIPIDETVYFNNIEEYSANKILQ